jgi:DNA polymerase (family 10)
MPKHNYEIAQTIKKLADLLDIAGENAFKVRAYKNAVQSINNSSQNIADLVKSGKDLSKLPGVGKSIADKIKEYIETGKIKRLEEIKKKVPGELTEMMKMTQLGPSRIKTLYQKLNITSIKQLEKAAKEGKIEQLSGFGQKTQDNILEETKRFRKEGTQKKRLKWAFAEEITNTYLQYLKKNKYITKAEAAGSYRRKKETVGDMDILAICDDPEKAMDHFVGYDEVGKIIAKGTTRSSVLLNSGLQVDLRVVPEESYGAALLYFTGSKEHNVAIRGIAQDKGHKINEYGIYKGNKIIAGKTEKEMYQAIGLPFIEPELRENRGEVEAAQKKNLPVLIELKDMQGDLQTHTTASDGTHDLSTMVGEAIKLGYSYYAVTDHSKRVTVANGLDEKRLRQQMEEIDIFNEKVKNITILKSIEVDIMPDGSLDLPDHVLKHLDVVICSVHYNTNLSEKKQTNRIIKAMDNPYFNILAHPTGRLIGERSAYEMNIEKILHAAREKGCFLEINAAPQRLDLNEFHAKLAKDIGVKLSISTDAHSTDNLHNMRYGVAQARRGWLEKDDILNTKQLKELKKLLKR